MAEIIQMIQLSPTMEEGLLVEWLKKEGDTVSVGDLIAEVETDKATMEMESFYDGTILKILVDEGSAVTVGKALAIIGDADEDITALLAEIASDAEKSKGEAAPAEPAAPSPSVTTPAAPSPASTASAPAPSLQPSSGERTLSSPLARRLASDHEVDLENIAGSGPAGRVIKRDVEAALRESSAAAVVSSSIEAPVGETQALSPMRRAIAKNTSEAWTIPAFMLTRVVRMDAALAFRTELNAQLALRDDGLKVSVNDLIIKASALALRDMPALNVAFREDGLHRYPQSRIGIAVAIDQGLITPVVANAENKGLGQIAAEVRDLAERARDRKLRPEEYSNASFSISNLGMFGIDHFTAILNPPGAAILAVGASKAVLVPADNDKGFTRETQMSVTLTCDHRAIDGAVGAKWLQHFAGFLEAPLTMML